MVSDGTKLRLQIIDEKDRNEYSFFIVPGFNSYLFAWEEFIKKVQKSKLSANIYFLETREKDTSFVATTDFSLERYGKDILEVIKQLELVEEKTVIISSSISSSALLWLFARKKVHPCYAFLVSPLPCLPYPKISVWYSLFLPPKVHQKVTKPLSKFFSHFFTWPDTRQHQYVLYGINRINWEKFSMFVNSIKDFNILREELEKIAIPVVIVGAKKDKGHPIRYVKKIAKTIENAEFFEAKYNSETVGEFLWKLIKGKLNCASNITAKLHVFT